MTNFVIGLFVVQLLVGGYLLSFVLGAGQKLSNARATRLPDPVVVGHLMLGLTSAGLWLIWVFTDEKAFAWATLATLLLGAAGGAFMAFRTVREDAAIDRPAVDPADVRVAEKQIPGVAIALHGLTGVTLVVCVLLVALGVVG